MSHPDYNRHRPYRDRVIALHEKHGAVAFSADAQFWTLGGPEHHEYVEFCKRLSFGPRSYCTVDRGEMLPLNGLPEGIIAHPHTEFMDIYELWSNPLALSYDSTEMLTAHPTKRSGSNAHDQKLIDMVRLTRIALADSTHRRLFVHANYMIAYPGTRTIRKHGAFFAEDYFRWTRLFVEQLFEYSVEWTGGVIERMEGAHTEMIDFHFIITR